MRETSLPVLERVKKASGMLFTRSKSWHRSRWVKPSPIRAEHQRSSNPSPMPTSANPATTSASCTTRPVFPASTPSSMMRWNSSIGITVVALPPSTATAKTMNHPLKGLACASTRRAVPRGKWCCSTEWSRARGLNMAPSPRLTPSPSRGLMRRG